MADDVFDDGGTTPSALPSEVFLLALTNEVNRSDVCKMVHAQKHMLTRFEKTNEMLLNFNALSKSRYDTTHNDFKKHTLLLTEMKKDLDTVFQRIRVLKGKLSKMYPEAFTACGDVYNVLEEEDEIKEDEESMTPTPLSPPGHHPLLGRAHSVQENPAQTASSQNHKSQPTRSPSYPQRRPTRVPINPAQRQSWPQGPRPRPNTSQPMQSHMQGQTLLEQAQGFLSSER